MPRNDRGAPPDDAAQDPGSDPRSPPQGDTPGEVQVRAAPHEGAPPIARFTVAHEAGVVLVDAIASTAEGAPVRHHWDFGDGTAYWGSDWEVHVYAAPFRAHTITLTVEDAAGLQATTSRDVQAVEDRPEAVVTVWSEGRTFWFDGQSSDAGAFALVQWDWDLGDGSLPKEGPVVEHTYQRPGHYTVHLQVEDVTGRRAEATHLVWVQPSMDAAYETIGGVSAATVRAEAVPQSLFPVVWLVAVVLGRLRQQAASVP